MALFQEASNQAAFLKFGAFGTTGSGKTMTLALVAIGLHKHIKSTKPVYFIDSETGSDYVRPLFDKAGVKLFVLKTQAFAQLIAGMKEAQGQTDIFMVDSITHFWRELMRAWKQKRNRVFISIRDFGPLKDEWHQYTNLFVNSKMHCLMAGRAADIFSDVVDEEATEDKGREITKSIKVGTKMAAEKETGYEPSLLIEMEKIFNEGSGKYTRRATVIKDRFNVIDSKSFDNPKFNDFLPHIKMLNLGGEHVGTDDANSIDMLASPDTSWSEMKRQQAIATEEIEGELVSAFPGQSTAEKKMKADILEVVFDSRSWTKIRDFKPEILQKGLASIRELCRSLKKEMPETDDMLAWLRAELIGHNSAVNPDDDVPSFEAKS